MYKKSFRGKKNRKVDRRIIKEAKQVSFCLIKNLKIKEKGIKKYFIFFLSNPRNRTTPVNYLT